MTKMISVCEDEYDKLEAVYKAASIFLDNTMNAAAFNSLVTALNSVQTRRAPKCLWMQCEYDTLTGTCPHCFPADSTRSGK